MRPRSVGSFEFGSAARERKPRCGYDRSGRAHFARGPMGAGSSLPTGEESFVRTWLCPLSVEMVAFAEARARPALCLPRVRTLDLVARKRVLAEIVPQRESGFERSLLGDWEFQELLWHSRIGTQVRLAQLWRTGTFHVMQFFPRNRDGRLAYKNATEALQCVGRGDCPFVIGFGHLLPAPAADCVVLEFAASGSVEAHFPRIAGVHASEEQARFILAELACALDFIHRRGVLHFGVFARHVLLDAAGHVRLAGFSHAVLLDTVGGDDAARVPAPRVPEYYVPPEVRPQCRKCTCGVAVQQLISSSLACSLCDSSSRGSTHRFGSKVTGRPARLAQRLISGWYVAGCGSLGGW